MKVQEPEPIGITERLIIRPLIPEDAEFTLRLLNAPSYLAFIGDKGVRDLAQAAAYLQDSPLRSYREHGHGIWRVALRASGLPIGMCGLLKRDCFQEADLGYAFLPEHTGQGYAREACLAVLDHGERVLGLQTVIAIVNPANRRSTTLLERLGFARAGLVTMPPPHAPEPVALYRRTRPEAQGLSAKPEEPVQDSRPCPGIRHRSKIS